jgi:hypothetical protein
LLDAVGKSRPHLTSVRASKLAIQLNVGEVGVRTIWKDISDNSLAGSLRYIEGECRLRIEFIASSQIKNSCESVMAAGMPFFS